MEQKEPTPYQQELARRIRKMGYDIGELTLRGNLPIQIEDAVIACIGQRGVFWDEDYAADWEELREELGDLPSELRDLFDDYDRAPVMAEVNSENSDPFRKLAEFNGAVLAMSIHKSGMECVTWDRTFDWERVMWGHYYMEDFQGAKRDFAIRAGLVDEDELFSKEELRAIRDLVNEALDSEEITISEDDLLELGKHAADLLPEEPSQREGPTMQL